MVLGLQGSHRAETGSRNGNSFWLREWSQSLILLSEGILELASSFRVLQHDGKMF